MSDEKKDSGSISISGSVSGKGIAIGHGAKASNTENNQGSPNQELKALLEELMEKLNDVPAEHQQDAEAVKAMAESLEQSVDKDTSKPILNIQAQGLRQAAETLKDVTPAVLTIASQVLMFIAKL